VLTRHLDQRAVAGLAGQRSRARAAFRDRPKLVIARHPKHLFEAAGGLDEGGAQMAHPLGDVAGQDQPVPGERRQRRETLAVNLARQVQVADGQNLHAASIIDNL